LTAACQGGLLIVDATRKGKTFPDAFSKTIPIWATVINRAVARISKDMQQSKCQVSNEGTPRLPWDCILHLPLWISDNEATQIESRLGGWVQDLFETEVDVAGLAQV
jgi:tRNA A64-2'-O-ribosylphosphate transferase